MGSSTSLRFLSSLSASSSSSSLVLKKRRKIFLHLGQRFLSLARDLGVVMVTCVACCCLFSSVGRRRGVFRGLEEGASQKRSASFFIRGCWPRKEHGRCTNPTFSKRKKYINAFFHYLKREQSTHSKPPSFKPPFFFFNIRVWLIFLV